MDEFSEISSNQPDYNAPVIPSGEELKEEIKSEELWLETNTLEKFDERRLMAQVKVDKSLSKRDRQLKKLFLQYVAKYKKNPRHYYQHWKQIKDIPSWFEMAMALFKEDEIPGQMKRTIRDFFNGMILYRDTKRSMERGEPIGEEQLNEYSEQYGEASPYNPTYNPEFEFEHQKEMDKFDVDAHMGALREEKYGFPRPEQSGYDLEGNITPQGGALLAMPKEPTTAILLPQEMVNPRPEVPKEQFETRFADQFLAKKPVEIKPQRKGGVGSLITKGAGTASDISQNIGNMFGKKESAIRGQSAARGAKVSTIKLDRTRIPDRSFGVKIPKTEIPKIPRAEIPKIKRGGKRTITPIKKIPPIQPFTINLNGVKKRKAKNTIDVAGNGLNIGKEMMKVGKSIKGVKGKKKRGGGFGVDIGNLKKLKIDNFKDKMPRIDIETGIAETHMLQKSIVPKQSKLSMRTMQGLNIERGSLRPPQVEKVRFNFNIAGDISKKKKRNVEYVEDDFFEEV